MYAGHPFVFFLDEKSQSNVLFTVCNLSSPILCPVKYTNRLSNTNLFSLEEQKSLKTIPIKYRNVTTNTGPPGSVLTRLDNAAFGEDNKEGIVAHFSYTNSVAQEEIVFFGKRERNVKYQSTPGNGYYAELLDGGLVSSQELRDGTLNGLCVTFNDDRAVMLLHYTNGKALGKFYVWTPIAGLPQSDGLAVEAEFKEPYDFQKFQLIGGSDLTSIDKPKSGTHLIGEANHPAKKFIASLNRASQRNIEVIAAGDGDFVPCPPEYADVISNTNLFTLNEQTLLKEIPLKYGKVTTNSGPTGSVLVSYKRWPVQWRENRIWFWAARFQFTNSVAWDDVTPGGGMLHHKIRNEDGDGYDLDYDTYNDGESDGGGYAGGGGASFRFHQIKHGVQDGLDVVMDHGDHCVQWRRYSNGMMVDKWLYWSPDGNTLMLWAKFKEPYDISKYQNK
jgi:hypothetical protein